MLKATVHRLSANIWKPLRYRRLAVLSRGSEKFNSTNVSLAFEHLTNRSIVRVSGEDAVEYLQGLVTNDMRHLKEDSSSQKDLAPKAMYCMFLDARGRVILDSIIYKSWSNDESGNKEVIFLLECDADMESTLIKHLKMYKLRKKVDISKISDEMDVWVEFIPGPSASKSDVILNYQYSTKSPNIVVCRDPRLSCLGIRHLCPKAKSPISDDKEQKILDPGHYMALRYYLGVGEGIRDIPPGVCFPLEANGDYLHGVSFHKGCYVGQELTARTHHTGVVRKRLMPLIFPKDVKIDILMKPDTIVTDGNTGKALGKVRGLTECEGMSVGLGLLRISEALKAASLKMNEAEVKTQRPFWWPEEAPRGVKPSPKA